MQLMSALNQPGGIRLFSNQLVSGGLVDFDKILEVGTQISVLTSLHGQGIIIQVVGQLITAFQSVFNVYAPMTADQIADISVDLVTEFWSYRLEDFVAFFHGARKGFYGEIKNRIDEPIILAMLVKYDNQRTKHLEERQMSLKSLEIPGGEPRQADPVGKGLDRMAGVMGDLKGYATKNAAKVKEHEKKNNITDPAQTINEKKPAK